MTILVLVCSALAWPTGTQRPGIYCVTVLGQMIGLQLILVVIGAGSISRERERGSLEILLTTSLTPAQIVLGTIPELARLVLPTLFMIFLTVEIGTLQGAFSFDFACSYLSVLAAMTISVGAGALLVSIACVRMSIAIPLAMVAPILMWHISLLVPKSLPFLVMGVYAIVPAALGLYLLFRPQTYRQFGAVFLACSLPLACVGFVCSVVSVESPGAVLSFPHLITGVRGWHPWRPLEWGWVDDIDGFAECFVVGHLLASVILVLTAVGFFTRLIGKKGRYQE